MHCEDDDDVRAWGLYLRLGVGSVGAGVGYVTMEEGNVLKGT